MNYLWAGMLLLGIVYGGFRGEMAAITEAALSSAKEAVSLCITLLGVMCFWVGMMNIAQKSGLLRTLAEKLDPLLNFLFPTLKKETKAKEYIATNVIANIFPATDPGHYDRLSQSVRIGKSIHDHGSCHSCDRYQHIGCRDLL